METQPLMVESETFLIDVAALMSQPREREEKSGTGGEKDYHHLEKATGLSSCAMVLEEGELVGLLTAKDLIRWVAWHQNLAEIQVGEVIDRRKVTLKQSEFRDFFSLLKTMGQEVNCKRRSIDCRKKTVLWQIGSLDLLSAVRMK